MNAQALMIGNYVTWDDRYEVLQVTQVNCDFMEMTKNGIFEGDCSEDQIEPIRLTAKWLEDFGFRFGNGFWYYDKLDPFTSVNVEFDHKNAQLYNANGYIGEPFCYVHNLQNVFYSLFFIKLRLPDNNKYMNSI